MSTASEQAQARLEAGDGAAAVALAQTAAECGDADAQFQLAIWHLAGTPLPRDFATARALLARSRSSGNADAALIEVALAANGTGSAPDWSGALALLRQAAAHHGGDAAQHLALIEAMKLTGEGDPVEMPAAQILATSPRTLHWKAFLTPAECAHIAMAVQDILEPSMVADPRTARLIAHPIRQSSAAPIGPTRESLPIQAILRRIAFASGTLVGQGESLNVLHYAPGQQYRMHMDALPNEPNQRIVTMILYLNEGYGGGGTRFEASGLTFAAKGGDALFFENVTSDGAPDPRSRHAGLPVTAGAKWVATRWIRAHPFDLWNPG